MKTRNQRIPHNVEKKKPEVCNNDKVGDVERVSSQGVPLGKF